MNGAERQQRRSRKALLEAATLLVIPTVIILMSAILAGGYFLRKEIEAREADRALLLRESVQNRAEILSTADDNLRMAFRKVICRIQQTSLTSRQRSEAEKQETVDFYTRILIEDLKTRPCDPPAG